MGIAIVVIIVKNDYYLQMVVANIFTIEVGPIVELFLKAMVIKFDFKAFQFFLVMSEIHFLYRQVASG